MKDPRFLSLVSKFIEVVHFMGLSYSTLLFAAQETDTQKLLYRFDGSMHVFLEYLDDYVTQEALLCADYTVGGISQRIESVLLNRGIFYSKFRNFRFFIKARLCFAFNPKNSTRGLCSMYVLSRSLWKVVGDTTTTGFSFYSKRATLMVLEASFMAKFADDYSYEFEESRIFLRKRIKNIVLISQIKKRLIESFERCFWRG